MFHRTANSVAAYEEAPYHADDAFFADDSGTDESQILDEVELDRVRQTMLDFVNATLATLTTRERDIIKLRFGLQHGHSQSRKEVASFFKCSVTNIEKAERRALARLRNAKFFADVHRIAADLGEEVISGIVEASSVYDHKN